MSIRNKTDYTDIAKRVGSEESIISIAFFGALKTKK